MLRRSVLQRLREMVHRDVLRPVQVGDGAGHPEDAVIAPGGEAQPVIGPADELPAGLVQLAVRPQLLGAHLGVAGGAVRAIPGGLHRPGGVHPVPDNLRGLRRGGRPGQLVIVQRGHVHADVDAVQHRP